jgi:hypothetical protein
MKVPVWETHSSAVKRTSNISNEERVYLAAHWYYLNGSNSMKYIHQTDIDVDDGVMCYVHR